MSTIVAPRTARPEVKGFFDERTSSIQYVVSDPSTRLCAIVDPVLDFDERSGATATKNADAVLGYVEKQGLEVEWILDTHPHADHLSAAQYLKGKTGAPTAIGEQVVAVQTLWKDIYNIPDLPGRRLAVGQAPCSRRAIPSWWDRYACDVLTWAYARFRHLCDRRRCLHTRHAVHARQRDGACGLSRRQRQEIVAVDSGYSGPARRHTPLYRHGQECRCVGATKTMPNIVSII
jgi:hypothetical protein